VALTSTFRSKDELLADALALGFSEFSEKIQSSLKNVPREDWWKENVRWYLSPGHCDHSDTGCPVTSLAPEITRAKLSIRKRSHRRQEANSYGLNTRFTSSYERIPMKLTGRTILITGGSAGIGLAFALKFLSLSNEVIVTGRRQSVLDEVKAKYPKLHTIQSDVADPRRSPPLRRA
jgi:hypothetical protein